MRFLLVKRMAFAYELWQYCNITRLIQKKMKKAKLLACVLCIPLLTSSCASIFTAAKQNITFAGKEGTAIYDNGQKIATIGETGEASARIRKKLSSKELVAKKKGYKPAIILLEARFNPVSCLNLLNVLAWGIDFATQKAFKWENTYIEIDMEMNEEK